MGFLHVLIQVLPGSKHLGATLVQAGHGVRPVWVVLANCLMLMSISFCPEFLGAERSLEGDAGMLPLLMPLEGLSIPHCDPTGFACVSNVFWLLRHLQGLFII